MRVRRVLPFLLLSALATIVVIGLSQAGDRTSPAQQDPERFDLQRALRTLDGAPAPLASLHRRANRLVTDGPQAFRERLRQLRGHPVVVNKWASWCGPCRHEFPFFQQASLRYGKRVAFVGVDSRDSRAEARAFLGEFPVPYPSYEDPAEEIARDIGAPANYPITVLLDERGRQAFIRQGGYASARQLEEDIARYLGVEPSGAGGRQAG